ncbi:hypothetical protein DL96DRAFT_1638157 [Flagelloscypha sp. PMI_526]|nr:hypothetical protein DL96DRAFT_1638157 [Flagelloscypha sp. PMI_526]
MSSPNPTLVAGYNLLNILGFVVLSSIVFTAYFSPGIHRSRNWYMAMFIWIWWCIPYSMLIGRQLDTEDKPPPKALCTFQASLVYASPPSVISANFALLAQIFSLLTETLYQRKGLEKKVSSVLLCLPIVVYVTIFFISLTVGIDNPSLVGRSSTATYCNIKHTVPSSVSSVACISFAIMLLLLEAVTFSLLYRHRNWVKQMKTSASPAPISLIVRIAFFSIGPIIAAILGGSSIGTQTLFDNPSIVLVTAASPLLAAAIFGTQNDILNVWMFWRRSGAAPYSHKLESKEALQTA